MAALRSSIIKELLIERARACIGSSIYRRNAMPEDAPHVLNCFRFTQWLWSTIGVQLPDRQLHCSQVVAISLEKVGIADLIFVPRLNYTIDMDDFGHVGIATGISTVIHATQWKNGVIEDSLPLFVNRGVLGICRIPEHYYCR